MDSIPIPIRPPAPASGEPASVGTFPSAEVPGHDAFGAAFRAGTRNQAEGAGPRDAASDAGAGGSAGQGAAGALAWPSRPGTEHPTSTDVTPPPRIGARYDVWRSATGDREGPEAVDGRLAPQVAADSRPAERDHAGPGISKALEGATAMEGAGIAPNPPLADGAPSPTHGPGGSDGVPLPGGREDLPMPAAVNGEGRSLEARQSAAAETTEAGRSLSNDSVLWMARTGSRPPHSRDAALPASAVAAGTGPAAAAADLSETVPTDAGTMAASGATVAPVAPAGQSMPSAGTAAAGHAGEPPATSAKERRASARSAAAGDPAAKAGIPAASRVAAGREVAAAPTATEESHTAGGSRHAPSGAALTPTLPLPAPLDGTAGTAGSAAGDATADRRGGPEAAGDDAARNRSSTAQGPRSAAPSEAWGGPPAMRLPPTPTDAKPHVSNRPDGAADGDGRALADLPPKRDPAGGPVSPPQAAATRPGAGIAAGEPAQTLPAGAGDPSPEGRASMSVEPLPGSATLMPGPASGAPPITAAVAPSAGAQLAQGAAQAIAAGLADARGNDRSGAVEIALDPPELGRVRMSFAEIGGTLTLSILAERPETAELMRRHLDLLGQEFARSGLDAPSVRVEAHGGQAFGQGGGGPGQPTPDAAMDRDILDGDASEVATQPHRRDVSVHTLDLRL